MSNKMAFSVIESAISDIKSDVFASNNVLEKLVIVANKSIEACQKLSKQHQDDLNNKIFDLVSSDVDCVSYCFDGEEVKLNNSELAVLCIICFSPDFKDSFSFFSLNIGLVEHFEDYSELWFRNELIDSLSSSDVRTYLLRILVKTESTEDISYGIISIEPNSNGEYVKSHQLLASFAQAYYGGSYDEDEGGFSIEGSNVFSIPKEATEITSHELSVLNRLLNVRHYMSIDELQFNSYEVGLYFKD